MHVARVAFASDLFYNEHIHEDKATLGRHEWNKNKLRSLYLDFALVLRTGVEKGRSLELIPISESTNKTSQYVRYLDHAACSSVAHRTAWSRKSTNHWDPSWYSTSDQTSAAKSCRLAALVSMCTNQEALVSWKKACTCLGTCTHNMIT